MTIQLGQTYRSADPRGGPRIRIERYTLGHDHAWVVDAQDSKRARWVLVRSLHATATTKNGTPRRTGYVLEQPATARDAARQATGQTACVPCGVCGTPWTDTHGYSGDCQAQETAAETRAAVGQPAEAQATNPRQPAYDAVYAYIRNLGDHLPPYPVERNAMIWRAVNAALDATPVGRCVSSHCIEGDHVIDLGPDVTRRIGDLG